MADTAVGLVFSSHLYQQMRASKLLLFLKPIYSLDSTPNMMLYQAPPAVRAGRLGLMLRRVVKAAHQFTFNKLSPGYILHWFAEQNDLRLWPWPADDDGARVPPDELQAYKLTHFFYGPCCLCAYLDDTLGYTEAKIHLLESVSTNLNDPKRRPFVGEWVAECAREEPCGYFVVLERFFACKVLLSKRYIKRKVPLKPGMWDFMKEESHEDSLLCGPGAGLRRIFTPYTNDPNFSRSKNELKRIREDFPEEAEEVEMKIDSLCEEGLPASEFWNLFVQCARCGFVMAKHRYPYSHRCPKRPKTSTDDETDANTTETDVDDSEGEDASNSYDHYLQFASAPSTPSRKDASSDLEWEVDSELEGQPAELDEEDDDPPDILTWLDMIRAPRALEASSH